MVYDKVIIVAFLTRKLQLSGLKSNGKSKIIAIGPRELLVEEHVVDCFYEVQGISNIHKYPKNTVINLIEKVREVITSYCTLQTYLISFEKFLEKDIATLRSEMNLTGLSTDVINQLSSFKNLKAQFKKMDLQPVKHTILGNRNCDNPEIVATLASEYLDHTPLILKPLCKLNKYCVSNTFIVRNDKELEKWMQDKFRLKEAINNDYIAEEFLINSHEFVALCSNLYGLIGAVLTLRENLSLNLLIRKGKPYPIEYLGVEQIRDNFPGLESFISQARKGPFLKNLKELFFIKGFYEDQNNIRCHNMYFDLRSESFASLIKYANHGKTWETISIEVIQDSYEFFDTKQHHLEYPISFQYSYTIMINFPNIEGLLIHQNKITEVDSKLIVFWKKVEGKEMNNAANEDDNILQLFLKNNNRQTILNDTKNILGKMVIDIDRSINSSKLERIRRSLPFVETVPNKPFVRRSTLAHCA